MPFKISAVLSSISKYNIILTIDLSIQKKEHRLVNSILDKIEKNEMTSNMLRDFEEISILCYKYQNSLTDVKLLTGKEYEITLRKNPSKHGHISFTLENIVLKPDQLLKVIQEEDEWQITAEFDSDSSDDSSDNSSDDFPDDLSKEFSMLFY